MRMLRGNSFSFSTRFSKNFDEDDFDDDPAVVVASVVDVGEYDSPR